MGATLVDTPVFKVNVDARVPSIQIANPVGASVVETREGPSGLATKAFFSRRSNCKTRALGSPKTPHLNLARTRNPGIW